MQVSVFCLPSIGSWEEIERRLLEQSPVRWLFAWTYNGLVPHDKIMRSLDMFATKVLPRFAGVAG